jgi:hypothetical protein
VFDERHRALPERWPAIDALWVLTGQPDVMQGSVTLPPSAPPESMSVVRNVTIPRDG